MWPFQFYSRDSTRRPGGEVRRELRGEANVLEPTIRSQGFLSLSLWTMTPSGETGRPEESGPRGLKGLETESSNPPIQGGSPGKRPPP